MTRAICCSVLWLPLLLPSLAQAQVATNAQIYQDQAVSCLLAIPDTSQAFVLQSPGVMSFLENALLAGWTGIGKDVFRADSLLTRRLPSLAYAVERADVVYAPARKRRLERTVSLALQYSWTSGAGQILLSERCTRSSVDHIFRRQAASLETPAYAETAGVLPAARWTRRYLEPIVLGSATVLTAFLFFNLRSNRGPSGG